MKGFKSIREMDLEMRPLNVLIGGNGSGKSNLLSFFALLSDMIDGRLQQHVGVAGLASSHLFLGPHVTERIDARLEFETADGVLSVSLGFAYGAVERLVLVEERLELVPNKGRPVEWAGGSGGGESGIPAAAEAGDPVARLALGLLAGIQCHHFHDTSPVARIRMGCFAGNNRRLAHDGGNLAALLLRLREGEPNVYRRIVSTFRFVAPYFKDFHPVPASPDSPNLVLQWRQEGAPEIFGIHQLSDGTLRAACLVTLLCLPPPEFPGLLVLDEPELGLHPAALALIASLVRDAASVGTVLVATQSSRFVDELESEDVIVVDREGQESSFSRPDPGVLGEWLDRYSLGEAWEKNLIGGAP